MQRNHYKLFVIRKAFSLTGKSSFLYSSYLLSLLHHPLHISCNLLVSDLGVDLRAGNRRMPHHLGDALYRNACLQSQRIEAMSSDMPSQRSANATSPTNGFEMG